MSKVPEPTVFVVDDDAQVRESLCWLIKSVGLEVESYASAREFLDRYDREEPGCLILDLRMPGMGGLQLQQQLTAQGVIIPIIMISAYGDVPAAVQAMKAGAVDFIEKPFTDQLLLERVHQAIERDAQYRRQRRQRADFDARFALLTPRQREVLEMVVAGSATKQIAFQLGISPRTVEVHRSHIMETMQADSVADLVRFVMQAEPVSQAAKPH